MSEARAARIVRMDGQVLQEGDGELLEAMRGGLADGLSRAEMRSRIEAQAREIERLKDELAARTAEGRELRARTRAAEAECRIKDAILHADKSGRLDALERRWLWERKRAAERVANAALPWLWLLAAFVFLALQLCRFAGI